MTKKEYFAVIRDIVSDNAELVAFVDHEVELLNKKSGSPRKPTKTQVENEGLKAEILDALAEVDEPVTITGLGEICSAIAGLSNQKVTHLLTALVKDGKIVKEYVKKVPYFAIAR